MQASAVDPGAAEERTEVKIADQELSILTIDTLPHLEKLRAEYIRLAGTLSGDAAITDKHIAALGKLATLDERCARFIATVTRETVPVMVLIREIQR